MVPFLLPTLVALLVAGAPAPPLAPDPPPAEEAVEAPWVVKRVTADGRTLVLWARRGGCDPETSAAVTETPDAVEIHVRHAVPAPGGPCPAIMVFDRLRVRLQEPISGRTLVGQSLTDAPPAVRMPGMLQLDAKDARFALRAQGLRPTGIRSGAITWQVPWPGSVVRGTRPTEVFLSNPTPEPRPAVLGRLRFRTVAKGDGAASSLRAGGSTRLDSADGAFVSRTAGRFAGHGKTLPQESLPDVQDCRLPRRGSVSGCYPLVAFYKALPEAEAVRASRMRLRGRQKAEGRRQKIWRNSIVCAGF